MDDDYQIIPTIIGKVHCQGEDWSPVRVTATPVRETQRFAKRNSTSADDLPPEN